ncbi:MAG: DUF2922 domain-containing protein [Clostridiaceae bacterium]|nr:DUF2922 domain-containing protein [Clostridiaceae bacterium]
MSKQLVMNFLNESGKKVSISLNSVKDTVTDAEVSAAMDLMILNQIFNTTGGDLVTKDSAQIIDKNTEALVVK